MSFRNIADSVTLAMRYYTKLPSDNGAGYTSSSSLGGNSSLCELLTWWAILDLNQ